MTVTYLIQLVGNVYTLTATVVGGVAPHAFRWTSSDTNRQPKTGNPITRSFGTAAKPWTETVTVTDGAGATASVARVLDLVSSDPTTPPPSVPTITLTAAQEAVLNAVPIGGDVEFVGPTTTTTATRTV